MCWKPSLPVYNSFVTSVLIIAFLIVRTVSVYYNIPGEKEEFSKATKALNLLTT